MLASSRYLYGRGATDDKGPIVACLAAVKELHDEGKLNHVNLCFIIEGEEEAHSSGLEDVVTQNRDWICLGSRVAGILISNNYWVDESVPCLT
jgi:di- and tripeptidase